MLNQDFREFIQSLNANQVRYLVVGGYAVAVHGHPRYTKDIDIWIDMSLIRSCSSAIRQVVLRFSTRFPAWTLPHATHTVSGFRLRHQNAASRVKVGDKFVCYMTKLSRWIGILEVQSEWFNDDAPIFYVKWLR